MSTHEARQLISVKWNSLRPVMLEVGARLVSIPTRGWLCRLFLSFNRTSNSGQDPQRESVCVYWEIRLGVRGITSHQGPELTSYPRDITSRVKMTTLSISPDNPFQVLIAESNDDPVSCLLNPKPFKDTAMTGAGYSSDPGLKGSITIAI